MHETLRKTSICTKGYVEIYIQRPFLDNKKGIGKILVMKIQTIDTCFGVSSTNNLFLFLIKQEKPQSQFLLVF
jgi:hypothetical protein